MGMSADCGEIKGGRQGKKGRRTRYRVLDLSENTDDLLDKERGNYDVRDDASPYYEQDGSEVKQEQVKEIEDNMAEDFYEDLDDEEDDPKREREGKDKSQEYNLFVKSNRRRGHCTTKKSKRQRSNST